MKRSRRHSALTALILFAAAALPAGASAAQEEVTFASGGATLHGCITRPDGAGPFPVIVFNHGAERNPPPCGPADLVHAYAEHGFAVFAFDRRGHGRSPGDYPGDLESQLRRLVPDPADLDKRLVALQEAYNGDVVAAVAWLLQRSDIDRTRVAMTGVGEGAVQTLLAAEKGLGLRGFIAFSPDAEVWRDGALRQRLEKAVDDARTPIFLAQAQNDATLGPTEALGRVLRQRGAPNVVKTYPAFGDERRENSVDFALHGGVPTWRADVFAFLDAVMGPTKPAASTLTGATPSAGVESEPMSAAGMAPDTGRSREVLELPGGESRSYTLLRPGEGGPFPTVILLHGHNGNGLGIGRVTGLLGLAPREGFAAVLPNGSARRWNFFPPGAVPKAFAAAAEDEGGLRDDAAMLLALIDDLVRRRIADPRRIYLAGYSDGAEMTFDMACRAPERFAAIAAIAGSMPAGAGNNCRPSRALPLLLIEGTADPQVRFSRDSTQQGPVDLWPIDRLLSFFRDLDGCEQPARRAELPHLDPADDTRVTVESWTDCRRAPIVLYRIEGGGHRLPGMATSPPGNRDLRVGETLWNFFHDKLSVAPAASAGLPSP